MAKKVQVLTVISRDCGIVNGAFVLELPPGSRSEQHQ